MAEDLTQLNVHLPAEVIRLIDGDDEREDDQGLRDRYGWTKRDLIIAAVRALDQLMTAHETYAKQHDPDVAELYLRVARELPGAIVKVPREGVHVGRRGDVPFAEVDDWLVWADDDGTLFALEQGGEGRPAVVRDGAVRPLRVPRAELN